MLNDTQPIIQVNTLSKTFRDFWGRPHVNALNDITFHIQPGEIFGLLGPNGSGKSTTIKILLGLLHPSKGNVRVLGHNPRNVQAKARIGYLPEESYLYPYLSARETLDFYGKLFDLNPTERKKRIDELLHMVGLAHTGHRPIREFSKGMARRIGLASALINDPDLIILDEPTSGLDPIGCRQVKDLIISLAKRGKSVLLSSHLLADVEDICDRVAILYSGHIQAQGTIDELLTHPSRATIQLPDCSPEQQNTALQNLRNLLGDDITISKPRQNLEQYFLQVVQRAAENDTQTHGARNEGTIPTYLEPHPLETLTKPHTPQPTPKPQQPTPKPQPPTPTTQQINQSLSDLTQPQPKRNDTPDA